MERYIFDVYAKTGDNEFCGFMRMYNPVAIIGNKTKEDPLLGSRHTVIIESEVPIDIEKARKEFPTLKIVKSRLETVLAEP